jgi:hypothetical protein
MKRKKERREKEEREKEGREGRKEEKEGRRKGEQEKRIAILVYQTEEERCAEKTQTCVNSV